MRVKEFADLIARCAEEIGCDGSRIASHKLGSSVAVHCTDPEDDSEYEFVGIDISRLPGCGCWDGIILQFRKSTKRR